MIQQNSFDESDLYIYKDFQHDFELFQKYLFEHFQINASIHSLVPVQDGSNTFDLFFFVPRGQKKLIDNYRERFPKIFRWYDIDLNTVWVYPQLFLMSLPRSRQATETRQ